MKIYLPNTSSMSIGGGWTFLRNFMNGMQDIGHEIVTDFKDCDVYFITGVTMTDKNELYEAKKQGKKIVLRVDNIPKKSRNKRMNPAQRLREFAALSDLVIYQSEWAKEYAGYYAGDGIIIFNGVDTTIFNSKDLDHNARIGRMLYVQYNRDENKRWDEVRYRFEMLSRSWKTARLAEPKLSIVGRFSPELIDAGFDFNDDEKIEYLGVIDDPEKMAQVMRQHEFLCFPAYADACPNTVIEAVCCGMDIAWINETGGTNEIIALARAGFDFSLDRMIAQYAGELTKIVSVGSV